MMQIKEFDIVLDIKTKEVKYRDPVSGQKLDEIEVIKGDYKSKGTNISMIRGDSEIINNLTSTAIDKALSANMGRELFQSVSNGKDLIATAIIDKGGSASGSDTFGELATAITNLPSGGGVIDLVGSLTHSGEYNSPSYLRALGPHSKGGGHCDGKILYVLRGAGL